MWPHLAMLEKVCDAGFKEPLTHSGSLRATCVSRSCAISIVLAVMLAVAAVFVLMFILVFIFTVALFVVAAVIVFAFMAVTSAFVFPIARHVDLAVPAFLNKIHGLAAGIVGGAVLTPFFLVARRYI